MPRMDSSSWASSSSRRTLGSEPRASARGCSCPRSRALKGAVRLWQSAATTILLLSLPSSAAAQPQPARTTSADRSAAAITIYNTNMGLVREVREVSLPAGDVELAWEDVTAQIRPETVHVKALDGDHAFTVVEQNFRYDVLTPSSLVQQYVGKPVTLVHVAPGTGETTRRQATLLSTGDATPTGYGYPSTGLGAGGYVNPWSFVYDLDGEITFGGDWRIVLPDEIPESFVSRPTLFWRLASTAAARRRIETSYLTWGMNWQADYVLLLSADGSKADLTGWVTLTNESGIPFDDATLQLVAGRVNVETPAGHEARVVVSAMNIELTSTPASHRGFVEENLFEYHLYTLQRPTDLADREQKQIELLAASAVPVERHYRLYGESYWLTSEQNGITEGLHPSVFLEFVNSEDHDLGMPLPGGTVRVYGTDPGGGTGREFLGEDVIDHTPREERVKLRVGSAFDIVADRRQTDYEILSNDVVETEWEVKLRNRKSEPVVVELREPTTGDWEVVRASVEWRKESARELRLDVTCPPDREVVVTWRLRVHLY
ncbi:MAG: DUF4139 domain-containing protein [Deltaproteobacteria bacterium]|nr:DUF4139 domain-containing protein [Deltaproteobacteria bacterium]